MSHSIRSFSVVIPSRNSDNIDHCVRALRDRGESNEVIVVDDGLTRFRPDCKYIPGVQPFVWARNVNLGLIAAHGSDVVVCGDDTRLLTPLGLTTLAETNRQPLGLVSASIEGFVGNDSQLCQQTGGLRSVDWLCFICVYIPRETINNIGLFDERFVGYGMEDVDYCVRARSSKWKVLVSDACVVEHGILASEFRDGNAESHDRKFQLNQRLFRKKWWYC